MKQFNDLITYFNDFYQFILRNNFVKKYVKNSSLLQKNKSVIIILQFSNKIKSLQQLVFEFDCQNIYNIHYDITMYCNQDILDNKFYYTINNILNNTSRTFDGDQDNFVTELNEYFNNILNQYFSFYLKNVGKQLYD